MEICEWNPIKHQANSGVNLEGDCKNEATILAGAGTNNWHVCESCSKDKFFNRMKKVLLSKPTIKE